METKVSEVINSDIRRKRLMRALPLLAFVALPLFTISAVAATTVTGTAISGVLTATYPVAIALNSATIGAPSTTSLNVTGGAIVVSDLRGSAGGTWNTTATLTNFSDAATHTIPSSSVSVTPNAVIPASSNLVNASASSGTGGAFTNPASAANATSVQFMSANGSGWGVFGLNPSFTWTVPANAFAGLGTVYTATMTFTTQ